MRLADEPFPGNMRIIEFWLEHPNLGDILERTPEMEVEWIQSDVLEPGTRIRMLLWVSGGDFDAFEAALREDPNVTAPLRNVAVADRRLVQLDLVDEGAARSFYPLLVQEGIVIQSIRTTVEGCECQLAFPDQATVTRFFDHCDRHDIPYEVHRTYEEQSAGTAPTVVLTDAQREALVTAVEIGYLNVPRDSSLQDLGRTLGISDSAASQRFRRGVKRLIEHVVELPLLERSA